MLMSGCMVTFNKLSQLQSLYPEKIRIFLDTFKNEMFKKHILLLKIISKKKKMFFGK